MNHPRDTTGTPTRRRFITLAGGAGVVFAAAALPGCSSAYPDAAVQPWQADAAGAADADPRRWMLAHALLAPNPHNRQPWLADLRRDGEITLVCDPDRLLPETDPFGRQILIGCGALVELAVIAGAERGWRVSVEPFPDGAPGATEGPGGRAVARLRLQRDAALPRDPLFTQIRRRHTNKGAYDNARPLDTAAWQALQAAGAAHGLLAGTVRDAVGIDTLRRLGRAAYEIELTTARTYLETAHLLRIGPDEIARHRDGVSINGLMPRLATALGLFDRYEVPAPGSANFGRVMERWTAAESGSGYLWIASQGNGRVAQLDAGRTYVRAHLQATARGIDMHPLSQPLQEFAEVRAQYDGVHRALGFDPAAVTVQMLARVGYGAAPATATPRRGLQALLQPGRQV